MSKTISIIVAVAEDYGIGLKNDLLAYISEDLKRFKRITTGNTIIMGKNTWLSLPKRPLPNRENIVITSQENSVVEGASVVNSIDEAIARCPEGKESFVIGGASVYRQFFGFANKLYITHIHKSFEADTFFPEIDLDVWKATEKSEVRTDEKSGVEYQYVTYLRK